MGRAASIAAMRRMGISSPQMAFPLSMPLARVTRGLWCLGMIRLPRLEPKAPGEMICSDVKESGKIDGAFSYRGHAYGFAVIYRPVMQEAG